MAKRTSSTFGIDLETAVSEISTRIDDAIDFQSSELEAAWSLSERYYNGYTDLEEFEGRSNVTKTEVRDAIRNTMPSIMRVLMSSTKPVGYIPSSPKHGMWVEQQANYVRTLFHTNGGYMLLYNSCLEALKLKIGILKAWWEPDPSPEYVKYTKVPLSTIEALSADPLIDIEEFEEADTQLGDIELYDVSFIKHKENGSIKTEVVPNYEFFISKNCNTIEQALEMGVHGQQQIVTVNEAIGMGIDYDGDWTELNAEDPELSTSSSSSTERRGYNKSEPNEVSSEDALKHEFLLTEAYVSYDLEGEGRTQIYRFLLGGTDHKYLHHERVQDSPYAIVTPIPVPHSVYGHSIADLTVVEQDTSTSLLRAAIDNAHLSNDAKILADPTKVDFDDLMNRALGAPVKARHGAQAQIIQTPFTAQGILSVLQYLDLDVQNKIGITKAAQGLDPDALQSTDKDAVRNTIATSQGQTELMVRNIVETGLIRFFRLLLRLSIQHMSPFQMMMLKGKVIPVDTRMFDPDAVAYPNVGIGTASPAQKQAALTAIVQKQEMYLEKYGPNNPFTSYHQLYNAWEDLLEANGIYNVERYFNIITPEVEKQWAKAQQQRQEQLAQQAREAQPIDPSKAYLEVEDGKRRIDELRLISDARKDERNLELKALTEEERINLERDRLAQDRVIKIFEAGAKSEEARLKKEQQSNDVNLSVSSGGGSSSQKTGSGQRLSNGSKSSSSSSASGGSK